jgi:hypothetical protein
MAPEGEAGCKEKTMPCVQQQNAIQKNQHNQGWIQVVRDDHHCYTQINVPLDYTAS